MTPFAWTRKGSQVTLLLETKGAWRDVQRTHRKGVLTDKYVPTQLHAPQPLQRLADAAGADIVDSNNTYDKRQSRSSSFPTLV